MHDLSDSTHRAPDAAAAPDATDDGAPAEDDTALSTALVEILPGVAVVLGAVPQSLELDLVDFGLVPAEDRAQLAATLGSLVGNTATVGGNAANAISNAQGLYRLSSATQTLLSNGATLAVKDGANLGSVWMNGDLVAQARFIPVSAVSAASLAAAIGPAVAMAALQMQLAEISGLVRTNIALTSQTLTTVRNEQWAELSGHVEAIDRALRQAQEIGSVPSSLWDTVAGDEAALRKQLDLYRRQVSAHLKQIDDARARREYLERNGKAIAFDTHALMSSLKAWAGYKALQAGKARAAGTDDPGEAQLLDIIVRDSQAELGPALAEATRLVDAVTRELRLITEIAGPTRNPLRRSARDHRAARGTSSGILDAVEPLADALRIPPPSLTAPGVVCSLKELDLDPYLRVLRWALDRDEGVRCLAFCYDRDQPDVVALGHSVLSRIDPEPWATLVVVTDRHLLTSRASDFRREGRIGRRVPLDDVRYVRVRPSRGGGRSPEIDVTLRDTDLRWGFHNDTDAADVSALAATLAESMRLPASERTALMNASPARITADDASAVIGASGWPEPS